MSELFFSLQDDLDSVCLKFKNPKVTLIVRAPDLPDGDVVIGNDDLDAAIAAINRLKARTPIAPFGAESGSDTPAVPTPESESVASVVDSPDSQS